jgi:RimJ/RimL family protein N-acetyltransferase
MTDADVRMRIELETDPQVMAHLGGPRPVADIERAHASAMRSAETGETWALLFIPDGSDDPAGWVCIFDSVHAGARQYEMGWMTLPAYQGRGYAAQAVRLLLDRAREQHRFGTIFAYPNQTNAASNRICEKCGFELTGHMELEFAGHRLRCNAWRITLFEEAAAG